MLALYRDTAVLAAKRAVKAWPVAFSVIVYGAVFVAASVLLAPLGMLGGVLLSFVSAACASGYLYLLSQAVNGLALRLTDLRRGVGVMFWDVVSVFFALFVIGLAVNFVLVPMAGPNAPAMRAVVGFAMAFFFNPVPELIYLGRTRSFQLLHESGRFVMANPVVWFLPNLLFALVVLAPTGALLVQHPGELLVLFGAAVSPLGMATFLRGWPWWAIPLLLLYLHYVMVFRGLLFQALSSGGARRRAWAAKLR